MRRESSLASPSAKLLPGDFFVGSLDTTVADHAPDLQLLGLCKLLDPVMSAQVERNLDCRAAGAF